MAGIPQGLRGSALAALIDHTVLKPEASAEDVRQFCQDARKHGFKSVCISPNRVQHAKALLRDSQVAITTVIGFPSGAVRSEIKAQEAAQAVKDGADELDMVLPVGVLKDGDTAAVHQDIAAVRQACPDKVLKVILETSKLTDPEIRRACGIAQAAGADFVKTSTGFGGDGATEHHVRLIRNAVGDALGVKASGGIKTYEAALRMIQAGASRIGTSSGTDIMQQADALAETAS